MPVTALLPVLCASRPIINKNETTMTTTKATKGDNEDDGLLVKRVTIFIASFANNLFSLTMSSGGKGLKHYIFNLFGF